MNTRNSAGWTYGLVTFSACSMTATIGHYAEGWAIAYFVGLACAGFGGISVYLMVGD